MGSVLKEVLESRWGSGLVKEKVSSSKVGRKQKIPYSEILKRALKTLL